MNNVIAAAIIAAGLVLASWIHAEGTRYELHHGSTSISLFDHKTGALFGATVGQREWIPLVGFQTTSTVRQSPAPE